MDSYAQTAMVGDLLRSRLPKMDHTTSVRIAPNLKRCIVIHAEHTTHDVEHTPYDPACVSPRISGQAADADTEPVPGLPPSFLLASRKAQQHQQLKQAADGGGASRVSACCVCKDPHRTWYA